MENGTIGSTYQEYIKEGKHNKELIAAGGDINYKNIRLFGQWTSFKSGLKEGSAQNEGENIFKDITQSGYFVGVEGKYRKLKASFVYEEFDRYDFRANMYDKIMPNDGNANDPKDCVGGGCYTGRTALDAYQDVKQESYIFNLAYNINDNLSVEFAYHKIKNPLDWVSNILPGHGEDRTKLNFYFKY
jgi:hypothetical protein